MQGTLKDMSMTSLNSVCFCLLFSYLQKTFILRLCLPFRVDSADDICFACYRFHYRGQMPHCFFHINISIAKIEFI